MNIVEYGDIVPTAKTFDSKTGTNNKRGINVLLFGTKQCEQFLNVLKSTIHNISLVRIDAIVITPKKWVQKGKKTKRMMLVLRFKQ